ncbi:hypothetical protein [Escherichia coli]|uniref:hypothetical protein n=1 Tax=Escherichia coli TaxID=562 RepID=UPI0039BF067A
MSMTTELAQLTPAGKFMFEACGQRWHHIKHGEAQYTEPRLTMVKLYQESDVLALVEALEAAQKQIADRNLELFKQSAHIAELTLSRKNAWKQASAARNGFDEQYALREAAEKRIAELEQKADIYDMLREDYEIKGSLVDFVDWQSKRISELEVRTVKLPDYSETYTTGFASEIEHQVRKVLEMAGVAVEGE